MTPKKSIPIHNHAAEASLFRRRAIFTFGCVLIMLMILLGNLYHLQIQSYSDYSTRSDDNRIRVVPLPPSRGLIYDRHGELLAENRPFYSLEIIPEQVKDMAKTLDALNTVIPISLDEREEFEKKLKYHRRFKPLTLKNRLSEDEVARFSVDMHRFAGVQVNAGLKRFYPHAEVLTHALGYVATINSTDKGKLEKANQWSDYAGTTHIGKLGVERYYEQVLHGKPGYSEEEVNNNGRAIRTLKSEPPIAGQDLYLTLDLALQQKAVELLDGRRGTIVALDPRDGGVLAMASSPSYDPNQFVHGISSKAYRALNNQDRPLINRATQGQYAPASTVKPMMALLALDENLITDKTRIWDSGVWQIPGVDHKYRDWKKWGHGWVDVYHAIIDSCDTFFYELSYKLGINNISAFMSQFGFGKQTGIDIHEESSGIMPSREWKQNRYRQPWYIGDTISIGIGQGYWTTTPLQLATATTMIANKGQAITPHFLNYVSQGEHTPELNWAKESAMTLKDAKHWDTIAEAMRLTAIESRFKDAPYTAAMKTGTAQVFSVAQDAKYKSEEVAEHLRDNALIVAYAPFENPTIVLAVVLENAGWGGVNAGPVARAMFDEYLLREQPLQQLSPPTQQANPQLSQQPNSREHRHD